MRKVLPLAGAFALALGILGSGQAMASAPCRDAHGKFIKCAAPAAAPMTPAKTAPMAPMAAKTNHCKDAKGKFIKCATPMAKAAAPAAKAKKS